MDPVVAIGAMSVDDKGRALGGLIPGTSNPGTIRRSAGGVARNVAEGLARLGVPTELISMVGDDETGRWLLEVTAEAEVDLSAVRVLRGERTASYLAVLDEDGAMMISIDDMEIVRRLGPEMLEESRDVIVEAAIVVVDANLQPAALDTVLEMAHEVGIGVCAVPISVVLAPRLRDRLSYLGVLTANADEAATLLGRASPVAGALEGIAAAKEMVEAGVEICVVTLGRDGVSYATREGASGHLPAGEASVRDATGAGDALTAGLVYGLVTGMPLEEAVRAGIACATLSLGEVGPVASDLNPERLRRAMQET
ncbi:MAG: carbohydrate kinase family protein [Anaerolineae bacterium]